jgi:hypothetical protein
MKPVDPDALGVTFGVDFSQSILLWPDWARGGDRVQGRRRGARGSFADEPTEEVDLTAWHMKEMAAALAHDSGDRSEDIMRVVGACVRSRLTLPQTRWVVRSREDLAEKLDELSHDDVERCFGKATASRDENEEDMDGDEQKAKAEPKSKKAARQILWRTAAEIRDRRPEWAWTYNGGGRLPRSALSLFAARPGVGKSTAARWFAAGYTLGTVEGCFHGPAAERGLHRHRGVTGGHGQAEPSRGGC